DKSVEVGTSDTVDAEAVPVLGVVPVEGRGSLPFALLHGESLVAVAAWALGEAGAELLDFDTSWAGVQEREGVLVVHDPLCPATPVPFLREAIGVALARHSVVVGVRPVTDTVKVVDGDVVGETVDRDGLVTVASPLVLPAAVVAALPEWPSFDDPAALVGELRGRYPVSFVEAPALARRVADASDLRLLEGLVAER
ncbi:MAG: 2-C-methyl-D-erythritol 4-phosphate cytidylyltransferase, partial [Nocardioidaceae bacterium]